MQRFSIASVVRSQRWRGWDSSWYSYVPQYVKHLHRYLAHLLINRMGMFDTLFSALLDQLLPRLLLLGTYMASNDLSLISVSLMLLLLGLLDKHLPLGSQARVRVWPACSRPGVWARTNSPGRA